MTARRQCLEAFDMLLDSRDELRFQISKKTGKYECMVHFDNGIYMHFISTREGVLTVDLRRRGMIDALRDMAKYDGIDGRTMAYGVAAYFGVEEGPGGGSSCRAERRHRER
ncbi:hypothetical protein PFICI_09918 [Pestalotiopsis fici W106-1]|uniref:Uncharacterized protein n=1 Tax=Pestalotiopsis fici (strain W106-1 / CGMCC3.15140) TaxID=1229662 RepID=W3WY91_PESFW|nr:uncharacterized protein PFICI_09918 [Pestalotiopsis fici W106-1]ETS77856.1 hypothetical protein PFICI_09918 [Pestalotiopsis fici W106-1]